MNYNTTEPSFTEIASLVANAQADILEAKQPLPTSRKLYIEEKTKQLTTILEDDYNKLLLHMKRLNEILILELHLLPQVKRALHRQELILATNKLRSHIDPEEVAAAGSWQKLLNLTNETMLWIYQVGYKQFEEKKLEQALSIFLTLAILNPHICDYLIALGTAQLALAQKTQALHTFSLASILEPEHPIIRFRCAEIYLDSEQFDDALLELEALREIIEKEKLNSIKPYFEFLKNKANNKEPL